MKNLLENKLKDEGVDINNLGDPEKYFYDTMNELTNNYMDVHQFLLEEYEKYVKEEVSNFRFFDNKEFKYGQVVYTDRSSFMDKQFGIDGRLMGIVVGHYMLDNTSSSDTARKESHYRIYYSDYNGYIGCDEKNIEALGKDDVIPDHLKTYPSYIYFRNQKFLVSKVRTFK